MNIPELFLFENHHNYDLKLSRPAYKGLDMIKPRGQFLAEKDFFEFFELFGKNMKYLKDFFIFFMIIVLKKNTLTILEH